LRLKNLSLLMIVIVLSLSVFASTEITVTPLNNNIRPNEVATFELVVKNVNLFITEYNIYSLSSNWLVEPESNKRMFELLPNEEEKIMISVKTLQEYNPGSYSPLIYIDEINPDSNKVINKHSEQLKLYLSPLGDVNYAPSVNLDIDMKEKIDPQETISLRLNFMNRNRLNLENMTLSILSEMEEFKQNLDISLGELEQKSVDISITPNKFQQPKNYKLFFVLKVQGQEIKVVEKDVEIIAVVPKFVTEINQDKLFLKSNYEMIVKNDGNTINTQKVLIPANFWQALFTTGVDDVIKEEGIRYLSWEVELTPNGNKTINYTTNYRIALYLIIFGLIIFGAYMYVKSPINVKKKATTTKSDTDGALSEVKITLEIENKTSKPIKNVDILDTIPGIANIQKDIAPGSLKPNSIQSTNRGTKVKWDLPLLDGFEHRIITYKIKSKLNILGEIEFPRAVVTYKISKDKVKKSYSNIYRLG
jgi:hypothetical protein